MSKETNNKNIIELNGVKYQRMDGVSDDEEVEVTLTSCIEANNGKFKYTILLLEGGLVWQGTGYAEYSGELWDSTSFLEDVRDNNVDGMEGIETDLTIKELSEFRSLLKQATDLGWL